MCIRDRARSECATADAFMQFRAPQHPSKHGCSLLVGTAPPHATAPAQQLYGKCSHVWVLRPSRQLTIIRLSAPLASEITRVAHAVRVLRGARRTAILQNMCRT
eukprot:7705767-Pyramimonas_sp.AAC.1